MLRKHGNLKYCWLCIVCKYTPFLFSEVSGGDGAPTRSDSPGPTIQTPTEVEEERPPDPELERRLLEYLSELSLTLPIDSLAITNQLNSVCRNMWELVSRVNICHSRCLTYSFFQLS